MEIDKADNTAGFVWLIVIQSILYGAMDVVSKQAYRIMDVYCFLFLRYALAAVIMLILWGRSVIPELREAKIKHYIVPGLCMSYAFIFSNLALMFTSATNMSFIRSLSALIAPLLALVFFGQKYGKKGIILQSGMLVGLYLLCAKGGLGGFGLGEVFALIAATLVAGSLVFGKTALDHVSAKTLSFVQTGLSVVFCGMAAVFTGGIRDVTMATASRIVLSLAYAAIGCTIAGYMLQNVALKHISARRVGMVQCLYPISTALIAFLVLGEKLTAMGIVGAVIITICVLLENAGTDSVQSLE